MLALITSLATLTDSVSLGARAVLGGWGIGTAVMCWIIITTSVPPAPEEDTILSLSNETRYAGLRLKKLWLTCFILAALAFASREYFADGRRRQK